MGDHLFSKAKVPNSNISVLNYPSCKISSSASHTFHPPFLSPNRSPISAQPSHYLIMLKVPQKPGFSPTSWTGGTTWQSRTAVCLAVFFQAFAHRAVRGGGGLLWLICLIGDLKVFKGVTKINHQRSRQTERRQIRHAGSFDRNNDD